MPISPEKQAQYPTNWATEIRPRILARDGHCCKWCGVRNHTWGYRKADGTFVAGGETWDAAHELLWGDLLSNPELKLIRIVLTVAHLEDPNPANCSDENLAALCQRCHNFLDQPMRQTNAKITRAQAHPNTDMYAAQRDAYRDKVQSFKERVDAFRASVMPAPANPEIDALIERGAE